MDQKTWLWKRKSSEKTILATLEEAQLAYSEKEEELQNSMKILNEKLASAVDECSAKDELVQNYKSDAELAAAEKQKAEEDIRRLKQELDEAQHQKLAANERLGHLNSTLKNCMEQLSLLRQEQDQRMHEAVMKTSQEFEKSHKKLEEKLASLTSENSYLSKALVVKEKLTEDLNSAKIQTESELQTLMARLDSVEKENAFLRYEFRSLEKELQFKNEEVEYSRSSFEASNKNHLESLKKIKKLEGECQRLRALTRKRLPAPSVHASVHRDMEAQRANQMNNRSKQLDFLIDQVQDLQRENKVFKEFLAKKDEEISHLQKLKNLESHERLEHTLLNLAAPDELSSASCYGVDDPNQTSSSSLALVLHEHNEFKDLKMIGASEMSLMDDFVEMEKLAIVAVDPPLEASDVASKELNYSDWLQNVTNMILEQHNASGRSVDELLEDVRASSCRTGYQHEPSQPLPISGYITWKSPASSPVSSLDNMDGSIKTLLDLISKFGSSPSEERDMRGDSLVDEYEVHVFRWRKKDITAALQEFSESCNKLLEEKTSFDKFSGDLAYFLGFIINTCISFQDNSSNIRAEFKKHLGGDGPGTALELESVQNLMLEMEKMHSLSQAEIKGLKNELSLTKLPGEDSDTNLLCPRKNNEALLHKLMQSQQELASVQREMEAVKESERMSEDQVENLKTINEDLETQLTVAKANLKQLVQKLSSAEVELDNKSHCCEELEGTCLELQLQLQSIANNHENQEGLLQTGMEISKASAKLAECEETMMKLGKQLKALGSAKELPDEDSAKRKLKQRSSLLDQMMSEDNGVINNEESPETKEIIIYNAVSLPDSHIATATTYDGIKLETRKAKSGALAIVPSKKRGGGGGAGFLRKLLLRRKKASSKNTTIYFGK